MAKSGPGIPIGKIRNIGVIAHIDAGKTTVSERILYYSGKEHRMGEVHDGNTVMDYLEEERERGITIVAAATTLPWADHTINLIDTPGHVDFTAEVERSLRVLDGAVIVFCGVAGVEAQSETVWRQADKYKVPRISFINKLDRTGADFNAAVESIRTRLATQNPLPLQIPVGLEEGHRGVIDLVEMRYLRFSEEEFGAEVYVEEIPKEYRDEAEFGHHQLIEAVAEANDILMEKYLEEDTLSVDELYAGIRELTISLRATPVLCGSALKHKGIQPLLDAVVAYLPSPKDVPPVKGLNPVTGEEEERHPLSKEPLCALAFKIQSDSHGDLVFLRIYSGELREGDKVLTGDKGRKERATRLWRIHADTRTHEERVGPGDIIGVVGLKFAVTGDTVTDSDHPLILEHTQFPETVISMAMEPASSDDRDKLLDVLSRLEREDPTFKYKTDDETGQLHNRRMGELHLEVIRHRIIREFKVKANVGEPRVTYRETAGARSSGTGVFEQTLAGREQYAKVSVEVEPAPELEHNEVFSVVAEGQGSPLHIKAALEGVASSLMSGPLGGYPVIHVRVRLTELLTREGETSTMAFSAAADFATREAMEKSTPRLLQPIMALEVTTPEDFVGGIIHDLNGRRAEISSVHPRNNLTVITAKAALSEMFGYATVSRSLSQGRATYTMEPCEYSAVPTGKIKDILGY